MSTICAISTAPGIGGIAVIRVSGPEAIRLSDRIFHARNAQKQLAHLAGGTLTYGQAFNRQGELIDEVVAALFRAPHSFTGEDTVELSCHGSLFIQQQLLQALIDAGCRLAEPGEFTRGGSRFDCLHFGRATSFSAQPNARRLQSGADPTA